MQRPMSSAGEVIASPWQWAHVRVSGWQLAELSLGANGALINGSVLCAPASNLPGLISAAPVATKFHIYQPCCCTYLAVMPCIHARVWMY